MTTLTEKFHAGSFLLSEAPGAAARRNGVLNSGQNLQAGTVLGRIVNGTTAAVVPGTNTGNGVFTIDATNPVRVGAKLGTYTIRCSVAAANGGTFQVYDPNGDLIGQVLVGATFDNQIKFAIADGASDFVVGDSFTIAVLTITGDYTAWAPAATDGSQRVAGLLLDTVDASSADTAAAIFVGPGEVVGDGLGWSGASANNILIGKGQLSELGIVVR